MLNYNYSCFYECNSDLMLFHVHALVKQQREKYYKNTLMGAAQDGYVTNSASVQLAARFTLVQSTLVSAWSQLSVCTERTSHCCFYAYYCKTIRLVKGV